MSKYLDEFGIIEEEVRTLIEKRSAYKANKDYVNADKVKDVLVEKGILILDGPKSTEWEVNIGKSSD